jgi:cytochrome P450
MRPPGPRAPALWQTAWFLRDPLAGLAAGRRRYGPVFGMRFVGFPPVVYVATAELAEQVYALDMRGGRAGDVRRRFLEPAVGEHSLLSLDGEPWWRHRRLLSPPLHGKSIAGYADRIAAIAAEQIAEWPRGRPFALRRGTQRITLEVILRLVFGIRDAERLAALRAALTELVEVGGSIRLLMMPPGMRAFLETSALARRMPFLATTRFFRARDVVDRILYDEIARRRDAPIPDGTDVLSRLLRARDDEGNAMTDRELRDELVTLLEAGHETTATGLAWAFERLMRNPAVLERLRAEIDGGEAETYLDAVVKEALRSRPVVYEAPRLVDEPVELGGYDIPAGWIAAPLIWLIHRDPDAFPEPAAFRPERFLGDGGSDEDKRAQRSWMPFGGGRRYCVGAQLGLLEMRVIIREVLSRLDLAAVDPAPEAARMAHVTLVPAKLARAVVKDRARPATAGRPARPAASAPGRSSSR